MAICGFTCTFCLLSDHCVTCAAVFVLVCVSTSSSTLPGNDGLGQETEYPLLSRLREITAVFGERYPAVCLVPLFLVECDS